MADVNTYSEEEVNKFLGLNPERAEDKKVIELMKEQTTVSLAGKTEKFDAYKLISIYLKQLDLAAKEDPSMARKIGALKREFISGLKNNKGHLSVNDPSFNAYMQATGFKFALLPSANFSALPPIYDISTSLDVKPIFTDMLLGPNSSLNPNLKRFMVRYFHIKYISDIESGKMHIDFKENEVLRRLQFDVFLNYSFTSALPRFYGTDSKKQQALNDYMKELKSLITSKMLLDVALEDLVHRRKIHPSEANLVLSEATVFIMNSVSLNRDGRDVAQSLNLLTDGVLSTNNVSQTLSNWKESTAKTFVKLYEEKGVDFDGASEAEKKFIVYTFPYYNVKTSAQMKNVLEAIRAVNSYLSKAVNLKRNDILYALLLGDPSIMKKFGSISSHVFQDKGYSAEESVEIYKQFIFSLIHDLSVDPSRASDPEYIRGYFNDFLSEIPERKKLEIMVKSDLKSRNVPNYSKNADAFLSVPLNVAIKAVSMAQQAIASTVRTSSKPLTTKVSLKTSESVEVFYRGRGKRTEKLYDINETNMPYLTPFNKTLFDELTMTIQKRKKKLKVKLSNMTIPVASYLSFMFNDMYARSKTMRGLLSSKGVSGLSEVMSINYSQGGTPSKEKLSSKDRIRIIHSRIYEALKDKSREEIVSEMSSTTFGKRAIMAADAYVESIAQLETGKKPLTQEEKDKLWKAALISFYTNVIYEFNLMEFLGFGNVYKNPSILNYSSLLELSSSLDSFLDSEYHLDLTEDFLLNKNGKGLRIGSGVNFLGFAGGTSLWVVDGQGNRRLLAYSTASGLKIVNRDLTLTSSDSLVLLYYKGKKDLSKLAEDPAKLWQEGSLYAYTSAFRFLTHNYHILTKKTLLEHSYNRSSTVFDEIEAVKHEIATPLLLHPDNPFAVNELPIIPITPRVVEERFEYTLFVPVETTDIAVKSSFSGLQSGANLEKLKALVKLLDINVDLEGKSSNQIINEIVGKLSVSVDPKVAEFVLEHFDSLSSLQEGGSILYDFSTGKEINPSDLRNLGNQGFAIKFENKDGDMVWGIVDSKGKKYIEGTVSSITDLTKEKVKQYLVSKAKPRGFLSIPSIFGRKIGAFSADVGASFSLYELPFETKSTISTPFGNKFKILASPSIFFSRLIHSDSRSNLTASLGVYGTPRSYYDALYRSSYTFDPTAVASLTYNRLLWKTESQALVSSLSGGFSLKKLFFGDISLKYRYKSFMIETGIGGFGKFNLKGKAYSFKFGLGYDRDRNNVMDYGVVLYKIKGLGLLLPSIVINEKSLLDYAWKGAKWLYHKVVGKKEHKKDEEQKKQVDNVQKENLANVNNT